MKTNSTHPTLRLGIVFSSLIVLLFSVSCEDQCQFENTYTYFEPVYTTFDELRSSVALTGPVEIESPGKIFFKNNYLFINEPNKGIHVINNRDPSNPVNEAFVKVPGSFDLAVKDNYLYTDSYIDLVIIDISDLDNIEEAGRVENVFSNYNSYGFYATEQQGVVTGWQEAINSEVSTADCDASDYGWGIYYESGIALDYAASSSFSSNMAVAPTNPGMGGSMARFALAQEHLYTLDVNRLLPFGLSSPTSPTAGEGLQLGWDIETIFPDDDIIFVGSQSGMHIIDLSNPVSPSLLSTYEHITSCDPVIVDGDIAYVTLRSGTQCSGFANQLEVIDVSDLEDPELLYVYDMANPRGLGKDGDVLFVCDDGLKIYDASDISAISANRLAHYQNIDAFDIIPFNNVAMVIGSEGLYQYNYADLNDIKLLSHIQVKSDDK